MILANDHMQEYPQWYQLEVATYKIIKRLTSTGELKDYLRNPDEFVRRFAILRLGELKLKESIPLLEDILNDYMESKENKEIAAWALKSVVVKHNIDFFASSILSSKYSGTENIDDIFPVYIYDNSPDIELDLSVQEITLELQEEIEDTRYYHESEFDMSFPYSQWLESVAREWSNNMRSSIRSLLKYFITAPKKLLLILYTIAVYKPYSFIKKKIRSRQNSMVYRVSPANRLKTILINILCVIFYPVKLVIRYKKLIACFIIAAYCFLTFTSYGKILTYRYLGTDLSITQNNVYHTVKDYLAYSWAEFSEFAGLSTQEKEIVQVNTKDTITENNWVKFRITAKTGLNLRKGPGVTTEKVLEKSLECNTIVNYLNEQTIDDSGMIWYYISTPDGNKGWVYSKWLEEMEEK